MKKIGCFVLSVVLFLSSISFSVSAKEPFEQRGIMIDEETASVVALLFVASRLEYSNWSNAVTVSSITPMYDANNIVDAYCLSLTDDESEAGYIVVSSWTGTNLIIEFADEGKSLTKDTASLLEWNPDSDKLYYLGGLAYTSNQNIAKKTGLAIRYSNETAEMQKEFIEKFEETWQIDNNGGGLCFINNSGEEIDDPVQYLINVHGSGIYSPVSNKSKYCFPYLMENSPQCSIYALAAVIYGSQNQILATPYSNYYDLFDDCFDIAIGNNSYNIVYYSSTSGVDVGQLGPLGRTTLITLGNTTWTASENLWGAFEKAKSELDAYPSRLSCLSIAFGYYNNHTVTVSGYEILSKGSSTYKFLRVQDGWHSSPRYVDMSGINPCTITRVFPGS